MGIPKVYICNNVDCKNENKYESEGFCDHCGTKLEKTNPTMRVTFYESLPGRISLGNNKSYIKGEMELLDNEIIIHKKSFWRGKDRGTKHIRYDNITSIDYDKGRLLAPSSIQLYLNSVEYSFRSGDAQRLKSFYDMIHEKIDEIEAKGDVGNVFSPIEELKKLAELRDMGAVTEEEFEVKKKQLLKL